MSSLVTVLMRRAAMGQHTPDIIHAPITTDHCGQHHKEPKRQAEPRQMQRNDVQAGGGAKRRPGKIIPFFCTINSGLAAAADVDATHNAVISLERFYTLD